MDMTWAEIEALYITNVDGTFAPIFEYDNFDSETDTFTNVVITTTAAEVYALFLTPTPKHLSLIHISEPTRPY